MSGASFAHMPPTHHWPGDDAGLSDNAGTDADMSHVVLADEERLAAAAAPPAATAAAALQQLEEGEEEEEEEAEASTSYSLDSLEQAKLLLSGGVAGAFSKSCTAPLARLTILYQVGDCLSATVQICDPSCRFVQSFNSASSGASVCR